MKIQEIHTRLNKNHENIRNPYDNHENTKNFRNPFDNHENHENH